MDDTSRRVNPFPYHYVDKDVQAMFLPLNLLQSLSLNPKYQMHNNFVKPNNLADNLKSFCGLLTFMSLALYRISAMLFDENMQRYQTVNFLYFATIFDALFYISGYVMNFVQHLVHSKDNVQLILTFQKIHRYIKNLTSTNCIITRNWSYAILLVVFHITTSSYVYVFYMHPPWYVIGYVFVLLTIDCNTIYAICVIKSLTKKAELWNQKVLLSLTNVSRVTRYDEIGHAYVNILECFNLYKKLFQLPVFFHIAETFLLGLIKTQVLIDFLHFHSKNPESGIFVVQGLLYVFMLKCLVIQIDVCYKTHAFYDAMKILQDLCVLVLASDCTDEEKKVYKNIRRLHRASYSRMTACGLFYIDISQPLNTMALLSNYIIVLLQFALL